jgi:hypothetical protein
MIKLSKITTGIRKHFFYSASYVQIFMFETQDTCFLHSTQGDEMPTNNVIKTGDSFVTN